MTLVDDIGVKLTLTSWEHCTKGKKYIIIRNSKTQELEYYFVEIEQ